MIDHNKISNMINHWMATPVNGYFYQGYGCNIKEQLLRNLTAFSADTFIAKMKTDIPILQQLDDDQLSIVSQTPDFENVYVYIKLGDIFIEIGKADTTTTAQDFYDVTAR